MTHQALIFDCDGTLADTMPIHYLAWTESLLAHGIEFPEDRFYALGGCPPAKIIALLAEEQGRTVDAVEMAAEKEALFLRSIPQIQPIPYVVDVVRRHHGRLPMAVGSGSCREVVARILGHLQIAHCFQSLVGAEDTTRHKPEPDVFLEAARRLGVPPRVCCVYEDSDLGIEAARRAGMTWFDVRTVHTPRRITPGK